ncbi:M16 family metallopeptidase [Spartinivicinus poritis]|uniref:Insulinase family protein n=1 Tax=Spartinivicinus poritis TaxID=2994640 RepID=A0ABT5UAH1_9GAMM|nr:insulinase family protein [Spartinivicinus sp. A2-2]MDE1463374.1 insulinase family protein [Spartinivicinus sp. A2-2]
MMYLLKSQKHKRKFLWGIIFILPIIILALHKTGYEEASATLIGVPASHVKKTATKEKDPEEESQTASKANSTSTSTSQSQEQPIQQTVKPDTDKEAQPLIQTDQQPSTPPKPEKVETITKAPITEQPPKIIPPKQPAETPAVNLTESDAQQKQTATPDTGKETQPIIQTDQQQSTPPKPEKAETITQTSITEQPPKVLPPKQSAETPAVNLTEPDTQQKQTTTPDTDKETQPIIQTDQQQSTPSKPEKAETITQTSITEQPPKVLPPKQPASPEPEITVTTAQPKDTPKKTEPEETVTTEAINQTTVTQTPQPTVEEQKPGKQQLTAEPVTVDKPVSKDLPESEPSITPEKPVQPSPAPISVTQPSKPEPEQKPKSETTKPVVKAPEQVTKSKPDSKKIPPAPKLTEVQKPLVKESPQTASESTKPSEPVKKMVDPRFESLEVLVSKDLPKRKISIQQWQTDKGAQVYFVAAPEIPMLDIRLVFDAGSARDAYIPGLAYLTNGMLGEGTKNLNSNQIAEQFESLGAKFSNGSYRDMATASLRTLTDEKYLKPSVKLFTEVVTDMNFPDDAVNRVKNQVLSSLQYIKQQPGKLAEQAFYANLYGEHPYSTPKEGTDKSIPSIKKNHLITFYKEYYVAKNLIIAMVGDISQQQAKQIANQITQPMNAGGHAEPLIKPIKTKQLSNQVEFPSSQTHVYMGALGLKKGNPDYPAIFVGNHILGGSGFGSRLFENVREKQGLAYSVGSGFILMRAAGPFLISLQTKAEQAKQALAIVKQTLHEFIKKGPTEKELSDAKQNILGSFPLSYASNSSIVGQLGSIGFYQLPLTYLDDFVAGIQKVTVQDIKQAFAKYVDPENMLVITVGPKS